MGEQLNNTGVGSSSQREFEEPVEENVDLLGGLSPDSPIEDILAKAHAEEEPAGSSEQEGKPPSEQGQPDETGEVVKTQEPEKGSKSGEQGEKVQPEQVEPEQVESEEELTGEEPEWFKKRFSRITKARDEYKQRAEQLEKLLSDPEVLRVALKKQGWTDEQIEQQLRQAGFVSDTEKPGGQEKQPQFDLSTPEGWQAYIDWRTQQVEKRAAERIKQELEEKERRRQAEEWVRQQESEARKIAKEKYNLDYDTQAKPLMEKYLNKHPEDAYLGHVKILRLAMSEEGIALGEQRGIQKEKQRQEKLKAASMEEQPLIAEDKVPDHNSSVEEILEYRRKHPDWSP
ncbi:MAG: hypothetical protein DRP74_07705 [Candidatus Omnitrophota bacterium]|nr:MAG: hypothetical protein DRP74_07705 [Candidatus Omnitrophota bacterium]